MLPARKTKGIPPVWFEAEYNPKENRYPVANLARSILTPTANAFAAVVYNLDVPRTIEVALVNPEWCKPMRVEMEALEKNMTWEKCDFPLGEKLVGCRWGFTIKHHSDGSIERYKAILVTKGYIVSIIQRLSFEFLKLILYELCSQ